MVKSSSAGYARLRSAPQSAASAAGPFTSAAAAGFPTTTDSDDGLESLWAPHTLEGSPQTEPVFRLLQHVRTQVQQAVDAPLSWDQLKSPTLTFSLVRPLVAKLTRNADHRRPAVSLIYVLLIVRVHFLERSDSDLAFANINASRADLCELLAIKCLSSFGGPSDRDQLLHVLTTAFNPFAGATLDAFHADEAVDQDTLDELHEFGRHESANALEVAVLSQAKRFVQDALVQQVISAIETGAVIYTPESTHALIQDNYKSRPVVQVYDWRHRPFLDHHLLRVPRIRGRIELWTFACMLALFLLVQARHDLERVTAWEALFIAWTLGFALDEWASIRQHGLTTYFGGAFNVLDSIWCLVFFAYLALRALGLHAAATTTTTGGGASAHELNELAFDTLGLGGCVLLPRLTISFLRGNVVLLALSKMIREFSVFMGLAFLTASGFLCTFRILSRGNGNWDLGHIAWLMLKIWLGSAFLGFDAAQQFHPTYGPILMTLFAILAQTLLLTILISLLSSTFTAVQANADTEIVYQMALRTIERAKADPLTCYAPPLNLLALAILLPVRYCAPARTLHKVQVYLARGLNLPVLLFLALHTRATDRRCRSGGSGGGGSGGSGLVLVAERTNRFLGRIPKTVLGGVVVPLLEGSVEQVAKEVFERQVTEEGAGAAGLDAEETTTPEDDEVASETDGDRNGAALPSAGKGPVVKQRSKDRRASLPTSPLARIFDHRVVAPLPRSARVQSEDATRRTEELERHVAKLEGLLHEVLGELRKARGHDSTGVALSKPRES